MPDLTPLSWPSVKALGEQVSHVEFNNFVDSVKRLFAALGPVDDGQGEDVKTRMDAMVAAIGDTVAGLSAYDLAVAQGFEGDITAWLTSLQGPAGAAGADGAQGIQGVAGDVGPAGAAGADGAQGIQGVKGDTGDVGPQGIQGEIGPEGPAGAGGGAGLLDGVAAPSGATGSDGSFYIDTVADRLYGPRATGALAYSGSDVERLTADVVGNWDGVIDALITRVTVQRTLTVTTLGALFRQTQLFVGYTFRAFITDDSNNILHQTGWEAPPTGVQDRFVDLTFDTPPTLAAGSYRFGFEWQLNGSYANATVMRTLFAYTPIAYTGGAFVFKTGSGVTRTYQQPGLTNEDLQTDTRIRIRVGEVAVSWPTRSLDGGVATVAKAASHTLTNADAGKVMEFDGATAKTLTIPAGLAADMRLKVYNNGSGAVTFVASGTTIRNNASLAQYGTKELRHRASTNEWVLT